MATIPPTLIATSLPLNIADKNAIPYFPSGSIDLAVNTSGSIFSINPTVLLWNFQADAGWSFFAGMVGPAIALNFTMAGNYNGGQATVQVTNDEIQGGFLVGLTAGVSIEFVIRQASLHWVKNGWHSHFETTWNSKFSVNAGIQFDMVALILGIVAKIFDDEGKKNTLLQKVNNFNSNLLGSYGLFDDVSNGFVGNGNFSINPGFSLPLNFVPFIPVLDAIDKGLQELMGGLFIGPTIGIAIPATVRLTGLEVGGQTYSNLQVNGSTVTGTASGAGQGGNTLKVDLERSPGLDFTLGIGANVSVLKLFSVGGSFAIDILGLLGIRPDLGTFPTSLSNSLGSGSVGDLSNLEMAEVLLEWPT